MAFADTAVWTVVTVIFLSAWVILIVVTIRMGMEVRKRPPEIFQLRVFRYHGRLSRALRWLFVGQLAGFIATVPSVIGLAVTPMPPELALLVAWTVGWTALWSVGVSIGNVWVSRALGGPSKAEREGGLQHG